MPENMDFVKKKFTLISLFVVVIYVYSVEASPHLGEVIPTDGIYEISESQRILFSLCPELLNAPIVVAEDSRYHNRTSRCFRSETIGPCGNNRMFVVQNEIYGKCECNGDSSRRLIFHSATNQCYHIYAQGYCKPTEWITPDSELEPRCAQIPWLSSRTVGLGWRRETEASGYDTATSLVAFHGRCVRLGSFQPECGEDQRIVISASFHVKCGYYYLDEGHVASVGIFSPRRNACSPGSYLTVTGKCQTGWKWD